MESASQILHTEADRVRILAYVRLQPLDGSAIVTVEPAKKRRSLSQNALMHKWVGEVASKVSEYSGHTHDDVHEFFKRKFLAPQIIEIGGEVVERYTTTKMTPAEMSSYMDRIYEFATGIGIYLTLPEEAFAR